MDLPELDTDLRARIAELEREVRARDDFLAQAAHELRNPMSAIAIHVDALRIIAKRTADLPPQMTGGLEKLHRQIEHFVRRATTLLDVSRAASGEVTLDCAPCNFADIVQNSVEIFAPEIEARGIELALHINGAIPVVTDRLRTEQVVVNLLSNAIKYGEGKPISLRARATRGHVVFSVRDRGIGISEADRARIFERFERANGHSLEPGFGVGLWLVSRLVDAMRGTIAMTSALGRGSKFVVRLPRTPSSLTGSESQNE